VWFVRTWLVLKPIGDNAFTVQCVKSWAMLRHHKIPVSRGIQPNHATTFSTWDGMRHGPATSLARTLDEMDAFFFYIMLEEGINGDGCTQSSIRY
jgi:hypothetical protein